MSLDCGSRGIEVSIRSMITIRAMLSGLPNSRRFNLVWSRLWEDGGVVGMNDSRDECVDPEQEDEACR